MADDNSIHHAEVTGGYVGAVVQKNSGTINIYEAPDSDKLTRAELNDRRDFLAIVKKRWITDFLENLLPAQSMIELTREVQPDLVKHSFHAPRVSQILPTAMSEFEVFDQVGAGQSLLILGEPGAGKTITLLKLAKDLIERAEQNSTLLMPVVFNLSSWRSRDKNQGIADWLVKELTVRYGVSKTLGKTWIETKQLILLLDGLDEVRADRREVCVQAINKFIKEYGPTKVVVCSHIKEYKALSDKLEFEGAILIRPLTAEQINHYLNRSGEQLEAVRSVLQGNLELQELAKSPLMLRIMTQVYQGKQVEDLPQAVSPGERREGLFDAYIEQLFSQEIMGKPVEYQAPYPNQQTKRWLAWLAQIMGRANQKEFFIEQIQPTWLESKAQRIRYRFNTMLMGGSVFGLAFGLLTLLSSLWTVGFAPSEEVLLEIMQWCVINALIAFLFFGLALGWGNAAIETVETIKWDWKKARKGLVYGVAISILVWWLLSFAMLLWYGLSLPELFDDHNGYIKNFGLVGGLIAGLSYVLVNALKGPAIQKKTNPNQGIWVSLKSAIVIVLMISIPLIVLIVFRSDMPNTGLRVGLRWALTFGIGWGGGVPCIRHFTLRRILHHNNDIPQNYASFLNYASERGFMQKVGGGYIFMHQMLRDHFARMNLN